MAAMIATATALTLTIRFVGGSIGYSINYNVFVQKLGARLPELIIEYATRAGLPESSAVEFVTMFLTNPAAAAANVTGVTPAVLDGAAMGSRWAYAYALQNV